MIITEGSHSVSRHIRSKMAIYAYTPLPLLFGLYADDSSLLRTNDASAVDCPVLSEASKTGKSSSVGGRLILETKLLGSVGTDDTNEEGNNNRNNNDSNNYGSADDKEECSNEASEKRQICTNLRVYGVTVYKTELSLTILDFRGTYSLFEVDHFNLPKDWADMHNFIFICEALIKWA
ncbi:8519_t:CDS:2, partial [Acaulospora morrowiae]